jgi:hypothetical protein
VTRTIEIELKPIPPGAVPCPKCGSGDTPLYKFPGDAVSQFHAERIRARKCMDCEWIWWESP